MRTWLIVGAVVAVVATAAGVVVGQGRGEPIERLTPAQAHTRSLAGDIVFVDIRTPGEWRDTGIPASATPITMNQEPAQLLAALAKATAGDKSKPLALICRTGNRSSHLARQLRAAGYSHVIDVAEGVAGGPNGPGWVKAGLPLKRPD